MSLLLDGMVTNGHDVQNASFERARERLEEILAYLGQLPNTQQARPQLRSSRLPFRASVIASNLYLSYNLASVAWSPSGIPHYLRYSFSNASGSRPVHLLANVLSF